MDNFSNERPTMNYSFCPSSYLYNNFQTSKVQTLVIDTRSGQNFHKHNIKGSINLSTQRIDDCLNKKPNVTALSQLTTSDISDILDKDESKKFSKKKRCFCFFMMSEALLPRNFVQEIKRLSESDEHEDYFSVPQTVIESLLETTLDDAEDRQSILNALDLFKIFKREKIRESYIVLDCATGFFSRYPYMANHMQSDAIVTVIQTPTFSSFECDLPHDILDARLFLGSFNQTEKYELVKDLKITHILNMTTECDNIHEDKGIKYMKVSILDEDDKNIHDHFQDAYQFIHDALTEDVNNNVLVHCAMGKSRSATIIIMYLMKKFSWGFEKAFAFVKRKRDAICPNDGFVQRLQEFEKNQLAFVGVL